MIQSQLASHIEIKYNPLGIPSTNVPSTGLVQLFSGIAQGVSKIQRIGDRIALKRLAMRCKVVCSTGGIFASADSYNVVRIILIRWLADDAVETPVLSKVLALPTGTTDYTIAPYNNDAGEKFIVIDDFVTVVFNTPTYTGTGVNVEAGYGHVRLFQREYMKFGEPHIEYTANATTGVGNLYMLAVSDSTVSPSPQLLYNLDVEYEDA
jgi:hypothetical protein